MTVPRLQAALHRWFVPAVMLTLPLEFTKLYFPLHILEVSRILMLLGLAVFAIEMLRQPRRAYGWPRTASAVLLVVLLAYAFISSIAFRTTAGLADTVPFAIYMAVALVISQWASDEGRLRLAWLFFAITGIWLSILAIVLHLTGLYIWNPDLDSGYHRTSASFADPNILARYFFLVAGVCLVLLPVARTRRERAILYVAPMLEAAAIPFTFSRAGYVLFFAALLGGLLLTVRRRQALMVVAVSTLIFVGVTVSDSAARSREALLAHNVISVTHVEAPTPTASITPQASSSTAPIPDVTPSARRSLLDYIPIDTERRYLVTAAWAMFRSRPVFGVGFGNYQKELLGPYSHLRPSSYRTSLSHTALMTVLAELGIVGFLITLLAAATYLGEMLSPRRMPAIRPFATAAAIVVLLIGVDSQLSGRMLNEPYLWIAVGLGYAATVLGRTREDRARQ